jgi:hypothetical protein
MKRFSLVYPLFFFGLLSFFPLEAEVLVSNYSSPHSTSFPSVNSGQSLAQAFTTGHQLSVLENVRVNFRIYEGMDGPIQLSIHEDLQGLPGSLLSGGQLSLVKPLPVGSSVNLDFTSEGIELEADSRYWVIASCEYPAVGGQTHGWRWTRNPIVTSDVGWNIVPGYAFSSNNGATWNFGSDRPPLFMEISGAIIPEPATLSLLALGGLALLRKRK